MAGRVRQLSTPAHGVPSFPLSIAGKGGPPWLKNRRRVDVGGYQLAYEVAGTGSPAVVLEAGIGGAADT